ncbi:hypothetical protein HK096_000477, partial [Nowakowskiella sp. JEL0078]
NIQDEPNQVNPDPRPLQLSETPYQPEAALINIPLKTVIKAIMATLLGKASSTYNIRAELLKPAVTTIVKWLQYLALTMISRQISPSKWNKVNNYLIWKRKGSKADPGMHQPISLTQVCRKVVERVLLVSLNMYL